MLYPPAALIQFEQIVPISTMTWSIEMLHAAPASTSGWWLVHCAADSIQDGYSTQTTTIWNDRGEAILIARQTIAIFMKEMVFK